MTLPLPTIAGGYACTIHGVASGRGISNHVAFFHDGMALNDAHDLANATTLAVSIATHWASFIGVALHTSYSATDVAVYAMGSPLLPAVVHSIGAAGGDTGSQSFLQVAALIRQHVIRRGKGSQSRMFLSPISQDTISADGTTLDGTYQSAVIGNYDDFIAGVLADAIAVTSGTWSQVQISKKTFFGTYGRLFPIDGHTIDPSVVSQRRRLGR